MKRIFIAAAALAMISMAACSGKSGSAAADTDSTAVEETLAEVDVTEPAVIEVEAGDSITTNPTTVTFVDFNAEWCGPCQRFKPVYHKMAEKYAGKAVFLSVNTDSCPAEAKKFGVTGIPQITVILPNGEVSSVTGAMEEDAFEAMVQNAIAANDSIAGK